MRIIAGKLKGAALHMTKDKNTRPLKDIARESIFNLLKHSNKISFELEKSNILDLFAGTGSFGLECLSRYAEGVFFVEKEKNALKVLKNNVNKLKLKDKIKILPHDVLKIIEKKNIFDSKFDLIFCDPPFKNSSIAKIIEAIFNQNLIKKNGIIILHRNKTTREKLPNYFEIVDERTYGISKITFGKFLS